MALLTVDEDIQPLYKEVAKSTSSTARAWSAVITELQSAFNQLSRDEKYRSIIVFGSDILYKYYGKGQYIHIEKADADTTLVMYLIDVPNAKRYSSSNGGAFSDSSSTTTSASVYLYQLKNE